MPVTISATQITYNDSTTQTTAATGDVDSGTVMTFVQTSAPTGWTKSTTHDNKALRITNGTVDTGGSVGFTTAFGSHSPSGNVNSSVAMSNTSLSNNQIPSHNHKLIRNYWYDGNGRNGGWKDDAVNPHQFGPYGGLNNTGGGAAHNHSVSVNAQSFTSSNSLNLALQYVDIIIATKD